MIAHGGVAIHVIKKGLNRGLGYVSGYHMNDLFVGQFTDLPAALVHPLLHHTTHKIPSTDQFNIIRQEYNEHRMEFISVQFALMFSCTIPNGPINQSSSFISLPYTSWHWIVLEIVRLKESNRRIYL